MIDEKILWDRLKAQREENMQTIPEISAKVNMGINQAIGIMNKLAEEQEKETDFSELPPEVKAQILENDRKLREREDKK